MESLFPLAATGESFFYSFVEPRVAKPKLRPPPAWPRWGQSMLSYTQHGCRFTPAVFGYFSARAPASVEKEKLLPDCLPWNRRKEEDEKTREVFKEDTETGDDELRR